MSVANKKSKSKYIHFAFAFFICYRHLKNPPLFTNAIKNSINKNC